MPRPMKLRNVCGLPRFERFGPAPGCPRTEKISIEMTVDEYETIRLLDLEGFTQEECSAQMNIARTTVTAIYSEARRKVADAIVNGKRLVIGGGNFQICEGNAECCGKKGCSRKCGLQAEGRSCESCPNPFRNPESKGE